MTLKYCSLLKITCDKCGRRHLFEGTDRPHTRDLAKISGWTLGEVYDHCPRCVDPHIKAERGKDL